MISVDERAWWLEVGYGLEGVLPDSKVARFGDDYLGPNLTAGAYGEGVYQMTVAVGQEIERFYDPGAPLPPRPAAAPDWALACFGFFVFAGIVAVAIYFAERAGKLPSGGTSRGSPGTSSGTWGRSSTGPSLGSSRGTSGFGGGRSGGGGAGRKF